jgi:poly-gamma-glutamate capsule biosynthesis protein CapA/YwtB (metallophosphatase superfamily)
MQWLIMLFRSIYIVFFITCAFGVYIFLPALLPKANAQVNEKKGSKPPIVDTPQTVLLMGVGDLMLGSNYPSPNLLPRNGGKDILLEVAPVLKKADITFGNLEGVILSANGTPKQCKTPDYCYVFKSPDSYVQNYLDAGFDVLSLANNHTGDFGATGRENTTKVLQDAGIQFAGIEAHPYTIFEREGIRYGFCAFAPNTGSVSLLKIEEAVSLIRMLNDSCDIVIVSMHTGAEGSKYNHITRKDEIFVGENRGNPHSFSHQAIDAGADIVWGHGPHVVRAVEVYKDRFIAYSLGNFATYGTINVTGINGYAPIIEVETDRTGNFIRGKIHSAIQIKGKGPRWDISNRVVKEIKNLTQEDFPESNLSISKVGEITVRKGR